MNLILIYATFTNFKEAKKITDHLLKTKLIACANFLPIKNSYLWGKKIKNGKEIVAILKTKKQNWKKIKIEIAKLHSYKIPCIIKLDVESNDKFADWINSEMQ